MNQHFIKGVLFLLPLYLLSCSQKGQENERIAQNVAESDQSEFLHIEKIPLDLDLFSTNGYFRLLGNQILYVQAEIQDAYVFNMSGELVGKKLGKGEGPDKANGDLSYHIELPNGNHLFLGSSYVFKTFNSDLTEIVDKVTFNWGGRKAMYNTNELETPGLYSYHYRDEPYLDVEFLPVTDEGKIIIPVVISDHRNQGASVQSKPFEYFKNAYMLGVIDMETGVLEKVFHPFPKQFIAYRGYPYFYNFTYRYVSEGELFVADRLTDEIYVYDASSLKLKSTFGSRGMYFGDEVDHYDNYQDFLSGISVVNTLLSSYYLNLYADEDYIFRSYHVADHDPWGLQVYDRRTKELLADVRVPFRFNVFDKRGDYYFADGIRNEETEELAVYRFSIKNNELNLGE